MELNNDFEVKAPVDRTWAVLTDVERIAPCLPGAQLEEIEGDEYRGFVKIKVGPITATYKGVAAFVEQDDDNHRAVLKADGRDNRNGNASAVITATLEPVGDGVTKVTVATDLTITGKVAQFGRGVMADVSANLMSQFADNLEELLANGDEPTPAPQPTVTDSSGEARPVVRTIDAPEPEAVDLLQAAGAPVAKRLVPIVGLILLILILRRVLGD